MDQVCLHFCKGTTSIIIVDKRPTPNVSVTWKLYIILYTAEPLLFITETGGRVTKPQLFLDILA